MAAATPSKICWSSRWTTPDRKGGRALGYAIPAGDLDGDGADDLLTTSSIFRIEEDGIASSSPELHIHSGTPAAQTTTLR